MRTVPMVYNVTTRQLSRNSVSLCERLLVDDKLGFGSTGVKVKEIEAITSALPAAGFVGYGSSSRVMIMLLDKCWRGSISF